jgi:hypothetical protein
MSIRDVNKIQSIEANLRRLNTAEAELRAAYDVLCGIPDGRPEETAKGTSRLLRELAEVRESFMAEYGEAVWADRGSPPR